MIESAQSNETALPAPQELIGPPLVSMVQDFMQLLPPSTAAQALQARHLLDQMAYAAEGGQLTALGKLFHAMKAPLQTTADTGSAQPEKTDELLQLAARDAHAFLLMPTKAWPHSHHTLFASYRAVTKLHGKDSAHPADLWEGPIHTPCLPAPALITATPPSAALRAQLDQQVLALLQTGDPTFCHSLQQLSLGLAAHAQDATSWQLVAAWLEALEYGLLELDIYAKRLASRLLTHYANFAKGEESPPPLLLRDLLYFCATATEAAQQRQQSLPPLLAAVHQACQAAICTSAIGNATAVPAEQPQEPAPAPPADSSLPEFQTAPEVQPAATLLTGLATSTQVEPDSEFLQTAEALTQELDTEISHWTENDSGFAPTNAAKHAGELSRLAWAAGCTEVATLAHLLQRCLQHMPADASQTQHQACLRASEEIHRLLHQFAAGFMRRAHPQVLDALHLLLAHSPEPAPELAPAIPTSDSKEVPPNKVSELREKTVTPTSQAAPSGHRTHSSPTLSSLPASTMDAMHFAVLEEEVLSTWPRLQSALKQWIKVPLDPQARPILLRSLHTLKGSARLAGAMTWASQVHALEALALELPFITGSYGPSALAAPLEALRLAFVGLQQEMAGRHPMRVSGQLQQSPLEAVARHTQALWHSQDTGQQALAASTLSLNEIASSLQKLRTQIQDCAAWADTLMLHGELDLPYEWHEELHSLVHALNDCTDDLGTAQQQLQHEMGDAQHALSNHAGHLRALQHTLLYAQLQPFSHLQERLCACVQQAAGEVQKSVELHWRGSDTMMVRKVQEALVPALEHLLRNCIAHGIEKPAQRIVANKPESGSISLHLHTAGQQQILSICDDGAGLDTQAIRNRAVSLGLIDNSEPVDAARAVELILLPGLSTSDQVTELAGRGVGMDAVVHMIHELGGSLRISSTAGKGCRFEITLPAPPQVEQILPLRAGNWHIAIPARSLEAVRRIPTAEAQEALSHGVLQDATSAPLPIYWAGAVWQQSQHSLEPPLDGLRNLLIVRSDTARWGLIVDEVFATQEVTLQPPTDLKVPVTGLLGTASLPSGHVMQVYEPSGVLRAHEVRVLEQPTASTPAETAPSELERPLVLLADDSLSVRRLAQHLLQTHGYQVATAADGLEALQWLEATETLPALLVVDVEMPNMDGMELLRRVRTDARLQPLPVVMLTAHTAGPISHKAIDLGAQAFLTKPYSPNELLAQVHRYVQAAHRPSQP